MDNCLTYALRMARYGRAGDHLVIRKSHWGWFPHFSVMIELDNGDIVKKEYVPIGPRPRWLPPLFFHGQEVTTFYQLKDIDRSQSNRRCHSAAPLGTMWRRP
jgi:hypothetical protein